MTRSQRTAWVISPHADDESIACGGTVARLTRGGWDVAVLLVTSPSEGLIRMQETRAALACLGARLGATWNEPEQRFRASEGLARKLAALFESERPDLVIAPNPGEADRDHREVSITVRAALALHRPDDERSMPCLLESEVWSPLPKPDLIVDITTVVEMKTRAIRCYATQTARYRYERATLGLNSYRGELFGGGCLFAEAFAVPESSKGALEKLCIPWA